MAMQPVVHVCFMNTEMTNARKVPKSSLADGARQTPNGLNQPQEEGVTANELTRQGKQGLSETRGVYLGEGSVAR